MKKKSHTNTTLKKITTIIRNPQKIIIALNNRGIVILDDTKYIKLLFKNKIGRKINLMNPQTLNEKLQWLKLNDRNSKYTEMVDKAAAKQYIMRTLKSANIKNPKQYIIPTIGIYEKFEDIDFDNLPDQFVIKCTHDSGGVIIVKNKNEFLQNTKKYTDACKKINKSLRKNYYYSGREWPYKNVEPKIIIEKYIENHNKSDLVEYDFFCFNGEPKFVSLCFGDKEIHSKRYNDFYDMNFKKMDVTCEYNASNLSFSKPKNFNTMIKIAEILSKDVPFLRVDLYLCNDKIYAGELTFYHWSGFFNFTPRKYNKIFGDYLKLPSENNK